MEHLDNDMDDLFQKAGELYPLKVSESDWEGVAGKLQEESFGDLNALPGSNAIGIRNKRSRRLLLILIPLLLAGLVYTSGLIKQKHGTPAPLAGDAAAVINKTKITPSASDKPVISDKANPAVTNKAGLPVDQPGKGIPEPSENKVAGNGQGKKLKNSTNGNAINYSAAASRQTRRDISSKNNRIQPGADDLSDVSIAVVETSAFSQENFQTQLAKPLSLIPVSGSDQIISVHGAPLSASSSESAAIPQQGKKSVPIVQSSKGFYVGFIAGPDLSAVKFQSVNQLGFSLGALVGYRFNKHLAAETGLLWDKKYYYSTGEYFKKSQSSIPYNLVDLNGNCNMFEIPVAIRYDFAVKKNHGFFAKAGLSSYLMKKEHYSYSAESYVGNIWSGDSTFYNSTNNIFSILQISGGYEFGINRNTKIRIEPYVKIPLQGVGIGSMPISSAGLYFGISHSFR